MFRCPANTSLRRQGLYRMRGSVRVAPKPAINSLMVEMNLEPTSRSGRKIKLRESLVFSTTLLHSPAFMQCKSIFLEVDKAKPNVPYNPRVVSLNSIHQLIKLFFHWNSPRWKSQFVSCFAGSCWISGKSFLRLRISKLILGRVRCLSVLFFNMGQRISTTRKLCPSVHHVIIFNDEYGCFGGINCIKRHHKRVSLSKRRLSFNSTLLSRPTSY